MKVGRLNEANKKPEPYEADESKVSEEADFIAIALLKGVELFKRPPDFVVSQAQKQQSGEDVKNWREYLNRTANDVFILMRRRQPIHRHAQRRQAREPDRNSS